MSSLEDLSDQDKERAAALYKFVNQNPDVAKQVRKLAREKNPNIPVAEADVLDEKLEAQRKEFEEKLAARDKEYSENLQSTRRSEQHDKIRKAGLDPEVVEKVMVDEKIGSYDTAIKYVQAQQSLAPPTVESITPMSLPDGKDLWADKNKWAKQQAFDALAELQKKRAGVR